MLAVERDAVKRADAVDQLHLQGQDRHGGEGLRQELQGAVEDGVAQDQRIDLRLHGGSRCCVRERNRRGNAGQEERLDRARFRGRHRIGLRHQGGCGGCCQTEGGGEIAQERLLRLAGLVIGLAHADRHFVGELFPLRAIERGGCGGDVDLAEQHFLIERGGMEFGWQQAFTDALQLGAFAIGRPAIGKSGEQANGEQAFFLGERGGVFGHELEGAGIPRGCNVGAGGKPGFVSKRRQGTGVWSVVVPAPRWQLGRAG